MMRKKGLFLYITPSSAAYQMEERNEYRFQSRPKLGLLYLASALLDKREIRSEVWDQTISHFSASDVVRALDSGDYLFAGFYSAISMAERVAEYIRIITDKCRLDVPILVGGPSSVTAEYFLKAGCDIVCNGEGDETICDIADYLQGRKEIGDIPGICYSSQGKVVTAPPRPLITDLDALPFPDFSLTGIDGFHDFYIFTMRKPYITMVTSRGCPFNCSFCECPTIWNRKYRTRSTENVLAEIDDLVKKYSVKYIAFQDDVFGMDYSWTEEFCRKLKERRYNLRWMCILHPFSFRKDRFRMLAMLRDAGCDTVSCGLQSAHPEILRRLNRSPEEPDCIRQIVKAAKRLGMLSSVGFILGSPGETLQTIKTSMEFAFEVKPNYARFYNLVILPGSEIARRYGLDGKLCDFSRAEIEEMCCEANRKFFLDRKILFQNFSFILRHNPGWLLIGGRYAFHIRDVIGMGRKKHKEGAA